MLFEQIKTHGLGCFSYAIGCPLEGIMAVVDPRRDVGLYKSIADEFEMRITHIFETHVHADHVSGAQELRALTGADIFIHESAPVGYMSKKLKDGDEFTLGYAALRVIHTPGHTPNSVSFLISDLARSVEPEMILTGDLLFVGDVGRPDLPGEEILDEQIKNLYDSLYKTLKPLPDYLEVYPAHGQGSLCGQGMSAKPLSTLGYERLANTMLRCSDFEAFKRRVLSKLPVRPQSFSSIIATNLNGAAILPKTGYEEYALSAGKVDEFLKSGVILLDVRDSFSFGQAHIPGSINIDFSEGPMLNWVGLAVTPGLPLVLVLDSGMRFDEIFSELQRIGYDSVLGWLDGGVSAWAGSGRGTQNLPHLSASELRSRLDGSDRPVLIDVRSRDEFERLRIDGSINLPIDRIPETADCPADTDAEIVVICLSGFRAGIAASLLQARGCNNVSILEGGISQWSFA